MDVITTLRDALIYPFTVSVFLAILGTGVFRLTDRAHHTAQTLFGNSLLIFGVAVVGSVIGRLGGLSESPVIGALVPAVLTAIAGFGVYMLGEERVKSLASILSAVAFVLSFYTNFIAGAAERSGYDDVKFCRDQYAAAAISSSPNAMQNMNHVFGEWCNEALSQAK